MTRQLRLRLTGEQAQLGSVRASDVARLLLGVERAVARSAGHIIGHRVKPKGRWKAPIEEAARFRLLALEAGSIVGVLELPDVEVGEGAFDLNDAGLAQLALGRTLDGIQYGKSVPTDVARVLTEMADQVGIGSRYDSVTFSYQDEQDYRSEVVLGPQQRDRLRQISRSGRASTVDDHVVGTLVEADFEKFTARLRTSDNRAIDVDFPEELADDIQKALRAPADFVGEVEYDREAHRAVRVHLREITRGQQLAMGLELGDFWDEISVDELARLQSVQPISDVSVLYDDEASDEEIDALMAAIEA